MGLPSTSDERASQHLPACAGAARRPRCRGAAPRRRARPRPRTRACRTHHAWTWSSCAGPKPATPRTSRPGASRDVKSSSHGRPRRGVSWRSSCPELLERAARDVGQVPPRPTPCERRLPASQLREQPRRARRAASRPCRARLPRPRTTSVALGPLRHRRAQARVEPPARCARTARVDGPQHRRVRLRPRHDRRRLLAEAGRQPREQLGQRASPRNAANVTHRHALDAERRQDARDVVDERLVRHDDQHPLGPEALRLGERQVRHAVQSDGRLAAAGAALDGDQARGCRAR